MLIQLKKRKKNLQKAHDKKRRAIREMRDEPADCRRRKQAAECAACADGSVSGTDNGSRENVYGKSGDARQPGHVREGD